MTRCNGNKLQPHPTDCNKFLQCRNGVSVENSCASGLVFNPKMQACDWGFNYECTTSSPEQTTAEPRATVSQDATTRLWESNGYNSTVSVQPEPEEVTYGPISTSTATSTSVAFTMTPSRTIVLLGVARTTSPTTRPSTGRETPEVSTLPSSVISFKSVPHVTEEAGTLRRADDMTPAHGVNGGIFGFIFSICLIVGLLLFLKRSYVKRRFFNKCFKENKEKQIIFSESQRKRLSPDDIHVHIYAELPDPKDRNSYIYNPIPERTSICYATDASREQTRMDTTDDTYLEPSVHGSVRANSTTYLQNNSIYLLENDTLSRNDNGENKHNVLNHGFQCAEEDDIYSYVDKPGDRDTDTKSFSQLSPPSHQHNIDVASTKTSTTDPGYDAIGENLYDCVSEVRRLEDLSSTGDESGSNIDWPTDTAVSVTEMSAVSESQPDLDMSVASSDFSDFTDDDDDIEVDLESPYQDCFSGTQHVEQGDFTTSM